MASLRGSTTWMGGAGKTVAAAASTVGALATIFSLLYSYGIVGSAEGHRTIGTFGATWLGVRPVVDSADAIGDTLHLAATITDKHGSVIVGVRPTWISENSAVASANPDGSVTVRGPGATTVVATVGDLLARARIVVRQRVTAVSITGDSAMTLREGDHMPLRARPLDPRGHPVSGRPVQWLVSDPTVVAVDSLGNAVARRVGRVSLLATVDGVPARAVMTVVATPASLSALAGSAQHAPAGTMLPRPVVVRVTSRDGRPVDSVQVRFRAADGRGRVEPATVLSDADGRARTIWTLGDLPGPQTLLASVDRLDSAIAIAADAEPVASNIRIAPVQEPAQGAAGRTLADWVGVRISDSTGRLLPNVPVTWIPLDGGKVEAPTARTDSLGQARARWRLGSRAGEQRLRVQVGNAASAPLHTLTATATAGSPASIVVMSGDRQRARAGSALAKPILIRVADGADNPIADASLTLAPSSGTLPDSVVRTDSRGLASIQWTMAHTTGPYTLAVRAAGLHRTIRIAAFSLPAAPDNLSFDTPTTRGEAGHPFGSGGGVVAVVTDAYGNPISEASVRFSTQSGMVSPARAVTDARGRVKVRWTLAPRQGMQTLTGSVRGTDVSGALEVEAVAAHQRSRRR
ncbi:MAG: Ig-like domain-containing protein [Gemmatimonadota bacterium]|nr:Ig-like domain-containing protein [Gemmatimonadota bacterium]